jgi:glycosyltransferase involved in cell wall biosynthesis
MKNRMRVAMAQTADAIVSNSSAGDSYWDSRVGARVRRYVIPNAIPIDEIERVHAAVTFGAPIADTDSVVLFAGRFDAEKNVERLLKAVREIVRRPHTVAVLCGEGPLRTVVQRTIAAEHLSERIFTPGYVVDLWPLMKRADVMVANGLFEGRPNSVLEAMACNLPLVVSDIPAHREILDDQSARWVDPCDTSAVIAAVLDVLDSPATTRQRAAAARARVAEWTLSSIAAQYDRIYREVTSNRMALTSSKVS